MYNVLNLSKTGLKSMQVKMDAVSDELANSNTFGYKKKEIGFGELLNNQTYNNEVLTSGNANGFGINAGSKSGVSTVNFSQGTIVQSQKEYDMAIEGRGFFGVRDENNNLMLTRNGSFHIDSNRKILDDSGYPLVIDYYIPLEEWGNGPITIMSTGEIAGDVQGESVIYGKVVLYNPEVLDSLTPLGEGRYLPSENVALYNSIGNGHMLGDIIQNALETSNVDIGKSLVDMITTQRAYSLNAKAIQSTDEIMQLINGIKQ